MVRLGARRHCTRQVNGWAHEDWQDSEGTGGHKYWEMGSEARKTVPDRVKAKGGTLRDRKTRLNLRLGNGRRHGVYVSISTLSTLNCVVCTCMFVCVLMDLARFPKDNANTTPR
jgi:hypothetical protein